MRTELDALLSVQRYFASVLAEPWDIRTDLEAGEPPQRPFVLVELAGPAETSGPPVTQDLIVPVAVNLFLEQAATREAATQAALNLREVVWQAVKWGPDPKAPTTDRIPLYAYEARVEQHRFSVDPALIDPFTVTVQGVQSAPLVLPLTAAQLADAIAAALGAQPGDITAQDRAGSVWDVFYGGSLAGQRIGDPQISTGTATTILQGAPSPWRGPSDYMRVDSFSQNTVHDQTDETFAMIAVDLRLTFARGLPLPLDTRILQRVNATVGSGPEG